jgi:hypothetical protein
MPAWNPSIFGVVGNPRAVLVIVDEGRQGAPIFAQAKELLIVTVDLVGGTTTLAPNSNHAAHVFIFQAAQTSSE